MYNLLKKNIEKTANTMYFTIGISGTSDRILYGKNKGELKW